MAYLLNVFSPETWQTFQEEGRTVTGFSERRHKLARERVRNGDIFLCYLTDVSRWCGALRVDSDVFFDETPFFGDSGLFPVRFKVSPIVTLELESAIPMLDDSVWNTLSFTKGLEKTNRSWVGVIQNPLRAFEDIDGEEMLEVLKKEQSNPRIFPLTDAQKTRLSRKGVIRTLSGNVQVEIPTREDEDMESNGKIDESVPASTSRESIKMQAKVARIGAEMGFHIWVPKNDKSRVLQYISQGLSEKFTDALPFNYNDATLRTIEEIDVIWIQHESIVRAFEIEHTTAIYSGLLRMADLLTLQQNIDIRIHIVAPTERRDKVFSEIRRPVFAFLRRGPISKLCSFLAYESINTLAETEYLPHLNDSVIEEHEEFAEL